MRGKTIPHGNIPPEGLKSQAEKIALMRLNENILFLQKQINALTQRIDTLERKLSRKS